jgi:hypothetical protein
LGSREEHPNEETYSDEEIEWNHLKNKSKEFINEVEDREYNPISEPHFIVIFFS